MTSAADIRNFFTECRRLLEQQNDLRVQFSAMRDAATKVGIDWSQLKALASADVADHAEGAKGGKVKKLVDKAEFACSYADVLGIGGPEDERKRETRSSGPEPIADAAERVAAAVTPPRADAPAATESEPAGCMASTQAGEVEPDGDAGLHAGSPPGAESVPIVEETPAPQPLPPGGDDGGIPAFLRRAPPNDTLGTGRTRDEARA